MPALITDMASSTSTATFDMTRTTVTPSGRRFSMKPVRMPAARETTRVSPVTEPSSCSSSASMSCGFTDRTRTSAHSAASTFESEVWIA